MTLKKIASTWTRYAQTNEQEDAIKVIEKWLSKMGKKIVGGDTIGKEPQTVILDLTYQGSQIRVASTGFEDKEIGTSSYPGVKVFDVHIPSENDFALFKKTVEENTKKKEGSMNKILVAKVLVKIAKSLLGFDKGDALIVLQKAVDNLGGGKVKAIRKGTLKSLDEMYPAILYEIVNKKNKVIYAYLTKGNHARLFISMKATFTEPIKQVGIDNNIDRMKLEDAMKTLFLKADEKKVVPKAPAVKKWNDSMYKKYVEDMHETLQVMVKEGGGDVKMEDAVGDMANEAIDMDKKGWFSVGSNYPNGITKYLESKGIKDAVGALADAIYSGNA